MLKPVSGRTARALARRPGRLSGPQGSRSTNADCIRLGDQWSRTSELRHWLPRPLSRNHLLIAFASEVLSPRSKSNGRRCVRAAIIFSASRHVRLPGIARIADDVRV
jgi:hypothetical protein